VRFIVSFPQADRTTPSGGSPPDGFPSSSASRSRSRTTAATPATRHRDRRARTGDGYTVLLCGPANAISGSLFPSLSFNFLRDMIPVAGITREALVMVVHPSVPARTVPEYIAYAKANLASTKWPQPATAHRRTSPANCSSK
jgi:hypothetical protein